ncbi:MAG: hypothetical protein ING91_19370 [Rhodocyclaceae bacterium]|nr:hypothetical protein [Rhodocyclaceae bacterium]MCA3116395.1 hypothetical protein [Rhodocyclaceae bacterium]MCA3127070.1 hypothetical protein [Rhodocyclaceae bacterium]
MRNVRMCANCATRYAANLDRCPECDTHAEKAPDTSIAKASAQCAAHGCPLPGTHSDSTTGGGSWVCAAHRTAATSDWQAVTHRIRENGWLCALVARIHEVSPLLMTADAAQKASAKLVEYGMPALGWEPHEETVPQWAHRVIDGYWTVVTTGQCVSRPKPRPWQFRPGNVAGLTPQQVAA